jgi:Type II CAAX prenyl endopeptidase Rce1-like/Protein of unknown function (DUF2510)
MALMQPAGPAAKTRWWSAQPARADTPRISARRAYAEVLLVFGVFFSGGLVYAAFIVTGHSLPSGIHGWTEAVPSSFQEVSTTILCILVPLLLVRRRGLGPADLGIVKPTSVGLSQCIRMAAWAVLAFMVGGLVTSRLATANLPAPASYPALTLNLFHAAQAGFIEEIVVLAFVVVTLEQARRPRPEIIAVAVLLRASYHIYYGPGVLGIFIWASVFLWLYLRFRTIVPLIVVHSGWDIIIYLADRWGAVSGVAFLGFLALFITAFVLWLVDRSNRAKAEPRPMVAAPGWYLDPGGGGGLRWFNGWAWTPFAHPPP